MTHDEIATGVRAIVGKTFGVPPSSLTETTSPEDLDGWDSLAHASLVLRLEKWLNVDLDPRAASEAQTLDRLIGLVVTAVGDAE